MSDERLRYIEVVGGGPGSAGEDLEAAVQAVFQAARRRAELLAGEAGLRLTGVQQIAEIPEDGEHGGPVRVRLRVRFGIEPAQSMGGRAGFLAAD